MLTWQNLALATLAILSLVISGCGPTSGEGTAKASTPGSPPVTKVATVSPERATVRRTAEQPGQIEAFEVTALHAKLAGFVEDISVDIGDRLKKGQILAVLRVPEIEADFHQKRANVDESKALAKQAEANVDVARAGLVSAEAKVAAIQASIRRTEADVTRWQAEFTRVQQLAQERALTGSLVDETRSKLQAAQAGREEVTAQVKSAEATVAEAKAQLEKARSMVTTAISHVEVARFEAERAGAMVAYTKILAPYDGVVIRRHADTGQLTSPGTTSEPLFVVARTDKVTISVGVPEADAAFVDAGDAARIRVPTLDNRTFDGTVTRTAWALDNSTRTLRTEIDLEDRALRPGLYAYASIIVEEHKDALTVPSTAIVKDAGKSYCVAVTGGHAKRKEVKVGLIDGKKTEVLAGLDGQDKVVEANAASLADGQAVEETKPPGDAVKPKS